MLSNSADRFCPTWDTEQQNDMAPVKAPRHDIDPSQDTSAAFNGSESMCDVGETSCGKAGDSHPITIPCVKHTKFAVEIDAQ